MQQTTNWIETDVLVLGAGGAGLQAALSAREQGVRVLLLSKTAADAPNCTTWSAGYFTQTTAATEDELFRQVVSVGGFLNNQRLVETFVAQAPQRMPALERYGVNLETLANETAGMPGWFKVAGGTGRCGGLMTQPMRAAADNMGVQIKDSMLCTSLRPAHNSGWIVSATDMTTGVRVDVGARAVVVATGGGAAAFGRTDNPAGATGDGIVLAFQAGAELVDLECVSFQFPKDKVAGLLSDPGQAYRTKGAAHYFLGGIKIDERGATSRPGLFAAGEATGGVFGAARLGGTAMGDIVVFGALAGEHAAQHAMATQALDADAREPAADWRRGGAMAPADLSARVAATLWTHLGTMKTADSIEQAKAELDQAAADWENVAVETTDDLRVHAEARFAIKLGQLLAAATAKRCETRGCYWRLDYPEPNNERCLSNIVLRRDGDRICLDRRPVVTTRMTEPTEPMVGAGCFGYLPKS